MSAKMTWDSKADADMLLAILAEHSISVNYEAVAGRLGCTPGAVRERIKKLKKTNINAGDGDNTSPAKSTIQTPDSDAKVNGTKKRKIATPRTPNTSKGRSKKTKEELVAATTSLNSADRDMEEASKVKHEPSVEEDELMFSEFTSGMEDLHKEEA